MTGLVAEIQHARNETGRRRVAAAPAGPLERHTSFVSVTFLAKR